MKMLNEWKAEGHGPLVQIAHAGCGDDFCGREPDSVAGD